MITIDDCNQSLKNDRNKLEPPEFVVCDNVTVIQQRTTVTENILNLITNDMFWIGDVEILMKAAYAIQLKNDSVQGIGVQKATLRRCSDFKHNYLKVKGGLQQQAEGL